MELNEKYWTERYINNNATWDAGSITTPLKEYIDQLKDKNMRILIPGAGNAYEAEYLFEQGFKNVFVLDISEEPLKNMSRRLPKFPPEHLLLEDFFEHKGIYDLIIEQTFFCALPKQLRSSYVLKMHDLLSPEGKLVGVLFDEELNRVEPPFGGDRKEYEEHFKPYFKINKMEVCYNSIKPRAGRELFINLSNKISPHIDN